MIRNKRQIYHGVLDIPEGKCGSFWIEHEVRSAGAKFELANNRTMLLGGDRNQVVRYDHPTRWHRLLDHEHLWMTDLPIEQAQHDRELRPMRGRILVGGLGLGYAVTALASRRSVQQVVVVEKAPEVVELVAPYVLRNRPADRAKIEFVTADLFDYLQQTTERFTWGFYDIWASDSENTFHTMVVPLRRLSASKVGQVVCWNENVMRGQLYFALEGRMRVARGDWAALTPPGHPAPTLEDAATPQGDIWHDWAVPFFRWMVAAKPDEARMRHGMQRYAAWYGRPECIAVWQLWTGLGYRGGATWQ